MHDLKSRFKKLTADAADCDIISNLATDPNKCAVFGRRSAQYRAMSQAINIELGALDARAGDGKSAI